MHGFDFIPALHQDINHNRISANVLLRRDERRFFSAAGKHCSGMPVSPITWAKRNSTIPDVWSVNLPA
jgi:hypothetical protein